MVTLIRKLFDRRKQTDTPPQTEEVVDALKRLAANEDFQLFRGLILCYHADCVKTIANCPGEVVDIVRGQMNAYDNLFNLTSDKGITRLANGNDPEMQQFVGLAASQENDYTC